MASSLLRGVAALVLLAVAGVAVAEDHFYKADLHDLTLADGPKTLPTPQPNWRLRERAWAQLPSIVLDGPGEAYADVVQPNRLWAVPEPRDLQPTFHIRVEKDGDITGRLYYPKTDWSGMAVYRFTLAATTAKSDARDDFRRAKAGHYRQLLARNLPGAAWFRHEAQQAEQGVGAKSSNPPVQGAAVPAPPTLLSDDSGLVHTYDLFSGGRAVSENLQLDRRLAGAKAEEATEDIAKIAGISVAEIDWTPLIKGIKPSLDPLAARIPADQHVVFFPTFSAAVQAIDQAERQGTLVVFLAEPRSEDAGVKERYQRQLGLSLSGLGRLLGPHVARSVAITGSDPYFRTGTDLAVLFETPNPALLESLLMTRIALAAAKQPAAKAEQGTIDGLAYRGFRSPDRKICSYVAKLDEAVAVTNSPHQLKRLAAVAHKKSPAIASLPEYIFFRNRYRLGDGDETALVFLSDVTIRRWCGPRWRIASSRQTRDLAVLTELQAANLDRLVKRQVEPGPIYTNFATADAGQWRLEADGVRSTVQGSLEFMTPIAEIPLDKVTKAEAQAYGQWRDSYQRNWRWAFDPIAIRLTLRDDRLAADTTVMPLIMNTEYREFAAISQGASLAARAGDPHDSLAHFILAINVKSPTFAQAENFISRMSSGVSLGWIGSSIAVYFDDDPFWRELAAVAPDKLERYMDDNVWRLPIGVQFEVSSGLRLTAFLAAFRAFVDQTAPGMAQWQTLNYKDQPYVKISPTERAKGDRTIPDKAALYYVASGDALLITPNENLLKRAIDRRLARKSGDKSLPAAPEWLGSSLGLRVDRRVWDMLSHMNQNEYQRSMQNLAWSNLPILNEWKRLYPDEDPVALHERVWKIKLACPGGGRYVWNEKYRTMESTVYGHPGEPKLGPAAPPALLEFARAAFGLSFEHQGLRARVSLERNAK